MKDITLNQAQEQVDKWIKTVGIKYFSELTNLGILMEIESINIITTRRY